MYFYIVYNIYACVCIYILDPQPAVGVQKVCATAAASSVCSIIYCILYSYIICTDLLVNIK